MNCFEGLSSAPLPDTGTLRQITFHRRKVCRKRAPHPSLNHGQLSGKFLIYRSRRHWNGSVHQGAVLLFPELMACQCPAFSIGGDANGLWCTPRKQAALRPFRPRMNNFHSHSDHLLTLLIEFGNENVVMMQEMPDAAGSCQPCAFRLAPRICFRTYAWQVEDRPPLTPHHLGACVKVYLSRRAKLGNGYAVQDGELSLLVERRRISKGMAIPKS